MTVAISKAAEEGAKAVICASTGNTSASAAAYAVRAGMTCAVLVPQGKIALGKMAQALVHGARLLQVDGNFDDCLELAQKLSVDYPVALVNSVNPMRIDGQKTAAFEICDALGRAPDVHCIPVGNAGNITAYWKGYSEYAADGTGHQTRPRMFGFRRPAALGPHRGRSASAAKTRSHHRHRDPDRQPRLVDLGRVAARDESGGLIDKESPTGRSCRRTDCWPVARRSSSEPASAASVAGLLMTGRRPGWSPRRVDGSSAR